MKEPTLEQCMTRDSWENEGVKYLAFYWPQMGGYCAKALVKIDNSGYLEPCATVYVWHRGDFPFTESDRDFDDKPLSPAVLHICDFGDWSATMSMLAEFQSGNPIERIPRPTTIDIPSLPSLIEGRSPQFVSWEDRNK